jgi:hypothetical protein
VASFSILDKHQQWLLDLARHVCGALSDAGIHYRMVGGMAVFFHVDMLDPIAARLTTGVDVAIQRVDLPRVGQAVRPLRLELRNDRGLNVLAGTVYDRVRTVGHLVFVREKIRSGYCEAVPDFSQPTVTAEGFLLASVTDLVRMKLTSYRIIDKVHIIDMDGVGLITPEIENALPEALRHRLQQVRKEERQSAGAE